MVPRLVTCKPLEERRREFLAFIDDGNLYKNMIMEKERKDKEKER